MFKSFLNKIKTIGSINLCFLTSLYILLVFNNSFWQRAFTYFYHDYVILFFIFVILFCLYTILTVTFSVKYVIKPLLIFLLITGSASSWFTDQFGTIIDKNMIVNAVTTTTAEANNLITFQFILHIFLTSILPSLYIIWVKVKHRTFFKKFLNNLFVIILCLFVAGGSGFVISRDLVSTFRDHKDLKVINPIIPIASVVRYVLDDYVSKPIPFEKVGLDAHQEPMHNKTRPRVLVVVVGETARAKDFSLQGYNKDTNPELEKRNVLYFGNTTSCGTATAQSVPCMFSPFPRSNYSPKKARAKSSLPDILATAGVNVEWWENNTDSKGVGDRIKMVDFYGMADPKFCILRECHDGIMLGPLDTYLNNVKGDSVLFLHMLGSHGPAYYKRYPEKFRRFKPECTGTDFNNCTQEEIVNAYDNTILYTDYFLASIIDKLKAHSDSFDGAIFYMSDHGESLGENGIYLHGLPYSIAPDEQTHIPFVMWLSDAFASTMNVDINCLRKDSATRPLSHDNLFPSVLTMMGVDTSLKDPKLDMFTSCEVPKIAPKK